MTTVAPAPLLAAVFSCSCWKSPFCWALCCGTLWLLLMVPRGAKKGKVRTWSSLLFGAATLALLGVSLPKLQDAPTQVVFYVFAAVTIVSAAAAIAMRSAVYSAIWFAMSLLGTGGLLFVQGAQFLGVATVVVYAGAIVVTFLFVVMLAQPEGHDVYDRMSWGWFAKPLSVIAATVMVGALALALASVKTTAIETADAAAKAAKKSAAKKVSTETTTVAATDKQNDVLAKAHMAKLGAQLFSRYLLSVEVAGTLLMIALVGAVAIVIHGKDEIMESEGAQP